MSPKTKVFIHSAIEASVFFWIVNTWSSYIGRNDASGLTSTGGFFLSLLASPVVFVAALLIGATCMYIRRTINILSTLFYVLIYSPALAAITYMIVYNH